MNLKKLPKWAWAVAGLVVIGVWWYLHKSASSTTTPAQGSGIDDNQLASDLASQLEAAGVGGTPDQGGAVSSATDAEILADLQALLTQSYSQAGTVSSTDGSGVFGSQSTPASQGAVTNPGGSQVTPQFIVPAAPNSAGIGYVVNPSSPTPQVYSPSGQNLTGYVGVLQPTPTPTPSRGGSAVAL